MPLPTSALLTALVWSVPPGDLQSANRTTVQAPPAATLALAGREQDGRVATLAFRLALAGRSRCTAQVPIHGLVLQHLSQFAQADRAGVIAAIPLDRGPGVIALVPGSPAAVAGIQPGDILLAIDGVALPAESGLAAPFSATRAHDRADAIDDLLAQVQPLTLMLLRDNRTVAVRMAALLACPSRVYLARSGQHNAYADGRHVFLTTGLLSLLHNDDELAFIIAHEMAHNILGHAALMRSGAVGKGIGRTFGKSGAIIRRTESEADSLGATIMLDAGLDPVRGAAILQRLGGADLGIALLASHEPTGQRLAAIAAVAAAHRHP